MSFLAFLAHPSFVIPWYLFGAGAAVWVAHDLRHANTALKTAMKWAWPIVVFFFSPIGLALYFATARAPGVAQAQDAARKKELHHAYERSMARRVNGAVIHCIAGDGLGIMTAMVIARVTEMSFWQEFWFEYAVGFAFGWFIFQYKSMTMMTDSKARALGMAFRAEFFSMLTVMGGMGAVMAFVTPMVVGMQPKPWTAAFWGFGMLGLLVGYVFTFPMNWLVVKIGWKHGMGSAEDAHPAQGRGPRLALFGAMCVLGLAATVLPGVLSLARERRSEDAARQAIAAFGTGADLAQADGAVQHGLAASLLAAHRALGEGRRAQASTALDNALRVAEVVRVAGLPPGPAAEDAVRRARRAVQNGRPDRATGLVAAAGAARAAPAAPKRHDSQDYAGAMLLDAAGGVVGKVRRVENGQALLAIGGVQDFWGFWDLRAEKLAWVPLGSLVAGPAHRVGKTYVMLPSLREPQLAVAQAAIAH